MAQHPDLHVVGVTCAACGASFTVRSTAESLNADVCSNCHPAYTGVERVVSSGGRIAWFNGRRALAAAQL